MHFIKAKSLLSSSNGMNLYRGCTHGCIYCDSRSLCYHTPIPFEDIEIKENAPELLEKALGSKRNKCMLGMGSMCDPYMHCEKDINLTRHCLELIEKYGFGATLITKSTLALRDIDLFEAIHKKSKFVLQVTLTTAEDSLCKILEPHVAVTSERVHLLEECAKRGIPTIVWFCPFLPYINDTFDNISKLLHICKKTQVKGIINFGIGLTLRQGNREYFYQQLDSHFPGLKEQYKTEFGLDYQLISKNNSQLMIFFRRFCASHTILSTPKDCFDYLKDFPKNRTSLQYELF